MKGNFSVVRFALVAALLGPVCGDLGGVAHANTRYLIKQTGSFDCGPAALATLLQSYLDIPLSESEAIRLTKAELNTGTSLLGLEEAATAKGCAANSFRMDLATLEQQMATYPLPVIVRTLEPSAHFSVLLDIGKDYVFLADPARGNIIVRKSTFLKLWYVPNLKSGLKEGYVFMAAGSDLSIPEKRRALMVNELKQQLENLQTLRVPLPSVRR